jgi:hypothetical protein
MGVSEMDLSAAVAVAASRQGGCDLDDEGGPCSECLDLVRDLIEAAAPLIAAAAWDEGYLRGFRDSELAVQHGADNPYREAAT